MGDKNLLEKIGAFIPGYKGYAEREGRRDCDKLLRIEIAKKFDQLKRIVDEKMVQEVNAENIEAVRLLDQLKTKLDTTANKVRYSSCGESGFFDAVQVDIKTLDMLYQYDLEIEDDVINLKQLVSSLMVSINLKEDCSFLFGEVFKLTEKVSNRDEIISKVI